MQKFERRSKAENKIPTASMADIAFLLLIFFMSTTIFKMEEGLPISLPRAETAAKQEREKIIRIWIDPTGRISIQDKLVEVAQIKDIMVATMRDNPSLIVAFNADHRTPNGVVSDVMEELKKANAVRVSFTSDKDKASGG